MVFVDGDQERRYTFGEHEALVARTAAAFADRFGIKPGDRVAILAANCPEWVVSFWATVSSGAICVGLNGWWTEDEIRYAVEHSEPKLLIADRKRAARIKGELGVPMLVIEDEFDALLEAYPEAELPTSPIAEEDPAIILYTSGTTGRAKGVVHSHGNVTNMIMVSFFHGARLMMANPKQAELPQLGQLRAGHEPALPRVGTSLCRGHRTRRRGEDRVADGPLRARERVETHREREDHGLGIHRHRLASPPASSRRSTSTT